MGAGYLVPTLAAVTLRSATVTLLDIVDSFVGLKVNASSVPSLEELDRRFHASGRQQRTAEDFLAVPGYAISPYIPQEMFRLFKDYPALERYADVRQGIKTGDIDLFLRFWHEVSFEKIFFDCATREQSEKDQRQWYPCNKGGEFCRWFGNLDYVINWRHDGYDIRHFVSANGRLRSRPQNLSYFFKRGITWSTVVTMGNASFRVSPAGRAFGRVAQRYSRNTRRTFLLFLVY